jgi:neurotransmitter:Na+ symporter, NSS family
VTASERGTSRETGTVGYSPAPTGGGGPVRETFASRFGALMTLIGVAIGLGNVWRFPYLVGKFGGAAFVLLYVLIAVVIGVPGLMAEWALGRHTRRGPVGAFAAGRFPFGRQLGWILFVGLIAATAYYTAVIGWVLYHAIGTLVTALGVPLDAAAVLPPESGFVARSFFLQLACTTTVILGCAVVLQRGLRSGIERVSKVLMPTLLVVLLVLVARSLTLPGAMEGVRWYILKFRLQDIDGRVMVAALGHAMFSLSLGGTFMVAYGSYLGAEEKLASAAWWTVTADTVSGLVAGLAIIPAVFALGLEPTSGPPLIFSTLPKVFAAIPAGGLFGFLFFAGLVGAGYLSDVGAFETLVAGLTDNTRLTRKRAIWVIAGAVLLFSMPPTINNRIFYPWDLTFGSGLQTTGALLAVITLAWCVNRSAALEELSTHGAAPVPRWLFLWIRFGIPSAILLVGTWWLLTSVLHTASGV